MPRARSRLRRAALVVLAAVVLLVGVFVATALWLLRSDDGTRWLLARLPGVKVQGLTGSAASGRFAADRLVINWPGSKVTVTIDGLDADGVRFRWEPERGVWVAIQADRVSARSVAVNSGPTSTAAPVPPSSLEMPLRLDVRALTVAELRIDELTPLYDLSAALQLGAERGTHHRIDRLALRWGRARVLEAQGSIGTASPLAVELSGKLASLDGVAQPWTATLDARGPLQRLEARGTLRGVAAADAPAPELDLSAQLEPFAAWPLAALSVQTQGLDLAALVAGAPQTRLSGSVELQGRALDAPIGAAVRLDNALPGRWNEGRLPASRLVLDLRGDLGRRDRIEVPAFDLQLADARQAAGRWRGSALWEGEVLRVTSTLAEVTPQRLDGRAAAMRLSGPLAFSMRGLPAPDGTPAPAGSTLSAEVDATLDGRLDAAPQPVQLVVQGKGDGRRIEITALRARAGAASAQGRLSAGRLDGGAWQVDTAGSLADFDPVPWWGGEAGSAWRKGPHRLSAEWQLDLRLPPGAAAMPVLTLAPRLVGSGSLQVHDSQIAGVPLHGRVALETVPGNEAPSRMRGEFVLGGNQFTIDGRADPLGKGAADRLQLDLRADALAALAPLARLHPSLGEWLPRQGSASASVLAQGRWPAIRSEGRADLRRLQAPAFAVERATVGWQLDSGADQTLQLTAEADTGRLGTQRLDRLRATLRGTLRAHRIEIGAELPVSPPAVAVQVLGLRGEAGMRAQLVGEGSWQTDAAGGVWRGRVERVAAGAGGGRGETVPGDWLEARDLQVELHLTPQGRLDRIEAAPGRVRLANASTLRWDAVRADLSGALLQLTLRAELEAFAVAPLLARAQPALGWGGDLRVGAQLDIRAADRFDADILVRRLDGDLQISTDGVVQPLGLSDLRLALTAHDGIWTFSQGLAGRALGELAGALRVASSPQRRWPEPEAPVDGVIQARVANLNVWGAWVPPGWRLAGELRTSASVGGRFGAPEYTGEVVGTDLGVRNLLQGVNVTGGDVLVKLEGAAARIERFTLRGGDGQLRISGGAEFGPSPSAQLKLQAERFRVLGRVDRQLIASGNAELGLKGDEVRLDGRFKIDEGLFDVGRSDAPSLDDDVTVQRPGAPVPDEAADAAARPRRNVVVAMDVDLGDKLRVRGRGLDTALAGQLRITTPGSRLAVQGTVSTVGGTYAAYGQKLEIERGVVGFSGAPDNPRLDILALRPNIDTRVGVAISGTLQLPRVRLYADPEMSDTDKLSWLVLGRAPDGLGRTDTALLQQAALALLAGEGEAPTDALLRNLGLDELSLRQADGDVRETVITLGKQLSRRWYVGYERGVNATNGTWQLIYRIAQRFTLRAQSGLDNSLDVIWVWRFGEAEDRRMPKSPAVPP